VAQRCLATAWPRSSHLRSAASSAFSRCEASNLCRDSTAGKDGCPVAVALAAVASLGFVLAQAPLLWEDFQAQVKGESEVTEREGSSLSLAGRGRADSSLLPFLRQVVWRRKGRRLESALPLPASESEDPSRSVTSLSPCLSTRAGTQAELRKGR
jgi:hypothetical protein